MNNSKTFAYIRVSSKEQNIGRQLEEFLKLKINKEDMYIDKISGKNFERPQYKLLLNILREGDLLYIKSIDRLGRNYREIQNEWKKLTQELKIDIKVIDLPILDTTNHKDILGNFTSELILQILSFVSEQELLNIKQRQNEGIQLAKKEGRHLGRNYKALPSNSDEILQQWAQNEITTSSCYTQLGISRSKFYTLIKEQNIRRK